MTLDEFRAARVWSDDLRVSVPEIPWGDSPFKSTPKGWVYPGDFHIEQVGPDWPEVMRKAGEWYLLLIQDEHVTNDLADLERRLYEDFAAEEMGWKPSPSTDPLPPMNTRDALSTLMAIASSWGENAEEGLPDRIDPEASDADLAAMELHDVDLDTARQCRDLWRAVAQVQRLLAQKGTEHLDPTAFTLCDLCDVVVDG